MHSVNKLLLSPTVNKLLAMADRLTVDHVFVRLAASIHEVVLQLWREEADLVVVALALLVHVDVPTHAAPAQHCVSQVATAMANVLGDVVLAICAFAFASAAHCVQCCRLLRCLLL